MCPCVGRDCRSSCPGCLVDAKVMCVVFSCSSRSISFSGNSWLLSYLAVGTVSHRAAMATAGNALTFFLPLVFTSLWMPDLGISDHSWVFHTLGIPFGIHKTCDTRFYNLITPWQRVLLFLICWLITSPRALSTSK